MGRLFFKHYSSQTQRMGSPKSSVITFFLGPRFLGRCVPLPLFFLASNSFSTSVTGVRSFFGSNWVDWPKILALVSFPLTPFGMLFTFPPDDKKRSTSCERSFLICAFVLVACIFLLANFCFIYTLRIDLEK